MSSLRRLHVSPRRRVSVPFVARLIETRHTQREATMRKIFDFELCRYASPLSHSLIQSILYV